MSFKYYIFFAQCMIFCINYDLISAKPMVGVNVKPANQGEFDFIVALKKASNDNSNFEKDYLCSGTLISKRDVLTLEHCFSFCPIEHTEVIVGSIDLKRGRKYYPKNFVTYHIWAVKKRLPLFQRNDVAIVKLKTDVSDEIKPALLSPLKYPFPNGLDVIAAGWGENENGKISPIMEKVELKLLSSLECIDRLKGLKVEINSLHIKYMCAVAEPFAVMCGGNSGGPVLHMGKLIGIHQGTCPYPEQPVHPKKINLNLSIDYFRNYITDVLNDKV